MKRTAQLIYQTALMESGFMLPDPKDFASHIYNSVKSSLNISPEATVEEEDTEEPEPETETEDISSTYNQEDVSTEPSDLKDEL